MAKLKPKPLEEYHVFLASPGDVDKERQAVRKFFEAYNRNTGRHNGLRFTVLDWENYGSAGVGRPQDLITKQTLERYKDSLALVIGLMAQRFGTKTGEHESGTEEEFEWAFAQNKQTGWPEIKWFFREIDKLEIPTDAKEARKALEQWERVQAFREKVQKEGDRQLYYKSYADIGNFREVLRNDLESWLADPERPWSPTRRDEQPSRSTGRGRKPDDVPPDPQKYFENLRVETKDIDIRGLLVGSERAHTFSIDDLYIPLTTSARAEPGRVGPEDEMRESVGGREQRVELDKMLQHRCVVITGDPGAGKTTFLKRIANILCRSRLGDAGSAAEEEMGLDGKPFPILIRIVELATHIAACRARNEGPGNDHSPAWLAHFLAATGDAFAWSLNEAFFRGQFESGAALIMFDGLDEAPTEKQRKSLTDLVQNASRAFDECRFVVTSRPAAYRDRTVLSGFEHARIDDLDDEAIETFLGHWCKALFHDRPAKRKQHLAELLGAFRGQRDIRSMAHNPVMLTALAVVHWNEKRLPEQRAYLYESVLGWLAKARELREGRPKPERCITLLQNLALEMQGHPKGRQVQVTRRWGARAIAPLLRGTPEDERVSEAEVILRDEELDSGIIVGRGERDIRFWHLIFQEYLAARALAGKSEKVQAEKLLASDKLYEPDWREVVLLLAGVLHQQDIERVDAMFETILAQLGENAQLGDKAQCVGLLGAVLRDLAPLGYEPADKRYATMADEVLGIFVTKKSEGIGIEVAIEAAEAIGRTGDPRFAEANAADNWVNIPTGSFLMGAQNTDEAAPNHDPEAVEKTEFGWGGESPVHKVDLEAYRIAKYPVTVGEFERFVAEGGYANQDHWKAGGFGEWQKPDKWDEQMSFPNRPVINVSWYEAMAYTASTGCRLPSEAEWERAARGAEGRRYPWGDEEPGKSLANYSSNIGNPTPVGVYPRGGTPEGIQDMAGNVWEWCRDVWHEDYKGAPTDGSAWTSGGKQSARVLRGGSWGSIGRLLRSAFRNGVRPDDRVGFIAFRVSAGT